MAKRQLGDCFLLVLPLLRSAGKVCPSLAIQKRKMEFKVVVVSETALDFNVVEEGKRTLRKY